jgi:hypothetical protein
MSCRLNDRVWNENIYNAQQEKVQKLTNHPQEKLMLTVFWDSHGSVQEHYQERETTINSARYSG